MNDKEGRKLLAKRLYLELQIFRYSTLRKSKKEIYDASYKIEALVTIYEIMLEAIEQVNEDTLNHLLLWNGGILELMYQEWLKKDDSSYEELSVHIMDELKLFSGEDFVILAKEESDGKRFNKAA